MTPRTPHMQFAYRRLPDQDARAPARHRVAIIGAGPVGLSLAIDLAQRGVASVVLDDSDRIGDGSRAICFAKRTLEIFDRLGIGERCLAKGVQWQKGRVFHRDQELYDFDLLPEAGHKFPAFINLQQYYVEGYLVERALELPLIDLRWKNKLVGLDQHGIGSQGASPLVGVEGAKPLVLLTIETPDGPYQIEADYVVACDGAKSPTRGMLGLDFKGEVFEDQFLIADVKMTAAFPTERWFWFDPPFHSGQSALLHKQPDDIWRIDLQLSPDADAKHEQRPEVVTPRIEKMLGHKNFELEWVSVYRFQCRRIDQFVHDRVIFAGDAAHQVSPFGARGANSGVQDAENLAWKLALTFAIEDFYANAPSALRSLPNERNRAFMKSYHIERSCAADENIRHSTRATDFIAPHTFAERGLRDAALGLAPTADFAKRMINSGRLSTATAYVGTPLSTPDEDAWAGGPPPGVAIPDAPVILEGHKFFFSDLLNQFSDWFVLLRHDADGVRIVSEGGAAWLLDGSDVLQARLDLTLGANYLIRPDRHVAGRWKSDNGKYAQAIDRAKGDP